MLTWDTHIRYCYRKLGWMFWRRSRLSTWLANFTQLCCSKPVTGSQSHWLGRCLRLQETHWNGISELCGSLLNLHLEYLILSILNPCLDICRYLTILFNCLVVWTYYFNAYRKRCKYWKVRHSRTCVYRLIHFRFFASDFLISIEAGFLFSNFCKI